MIVIGFDPSLARTGWAALDYDSGEMVACGTIRTLPSKHLFDRLADLAHDVAGVMGRYGPADVGIEDGISHRNGTTTRHLAMAWATIANIVYARQGVQPYAVNIGTLKKAATGNGKASKEEVIAAAVAKWWPACDDSDIADASWVAWVVRAHLLNTFPEDQP